MPGKAAVPRMGPPINCFPLLRSSLPPRLLASTKGSPMHSGGGNVNVPVNFLVPGTSTGASFNFGISFYSLSRISSSPYIACSPIKTAPSSGKAESKQRLRCWSSARKLHPEARDRSVCRPTCSYIPFTLKVTCRVASSRNCCCCCNRCTLCTCHFRDTCQQATGRKSFESLRQLWQCARGGDLGLFGPCLGA